MSALVNSKMEMLNEDELLSVAAQETGSPYSPEQFKAALLAETREGGALLLREGNTLFVVKETNKPDTISLRPINADSIENYLENMIKFIEFAEKRNIKYAVVDFSDEKILQLLRVLVKKVKNRFNLSYSVKKSKSGLFRVIFKLEPLGGLPVEGV